MRLLIILIFVFFLLIQLTGAGFLSFWGIAPNLILSFCLGLTILKGFDEFYWLFLIAGIFMDLYSDLPFGLLSLSLILSLYLTNLLYQKVFSLQKIWTRLILLISGITIYYSFIFLSSLIFEIKLNLFFQDFIGILLYNLILSIILLYGAEKILYQKKTKRNY